MALIILCLARLFTLMLFLGALEFIRATLWRNRHRILRALQLHAPADAGTPPQAPVQPSITKKAA